MPDWNRSVHDAEAARPRWPAGQVPAYHFVTYGFILGELVQRVTGTPVRQFLTEQLLAPLGLHADPSELVNQIVFNRRAVRQAVVPAAGISTSARQLARFYQMLLSGGALDGVRVLNPGTIDEARRPSSDGEVDAFIKRPIRWAQGFQLGGPGPDPRDMTRIMGVTSSPEAFGHAGNASCTAWADPTRDLAVVYLSSRQLGIPAGIRHHGQVSDAIIAACT
jgi:CubicO group peptidase (beta-lactamase class C family)